MRGFQKGRCISSTRIRYLAFGDDIGRQRNAGHLDDIARKYTFR